jgi:hypothetical protein
LTRQRSWPRVLAGGQRKSPELSCIFRGLKQGKMPFAGVAAVVRKAPWSGAPENSAPSDRKPGQGRNFGHAALPRWD